jgi:hypothetical protein
MTEQKNKPIRNGKGCAWRTLPNQRFAKNYDDIFRKRKINTGLRKQKDIYQQSSDAILTDGHDVVKVHKSSYVGSIREK